MRHPHHSDCQTAGHDAGPHPSRRHALATTLGGVGMAALGHLLRTGSVDAGDLPTHHPPRAKRIISLFQSGGPSQQELFDHKPLLRERHGDDLPESIRGGQRLTGMSQNQARLPLAGSKFAFQQHGASGTWVSELLPHHAKIVDEICVIRSMQTDAINHDPAITMCQTGFQIAGRPSLGAWLSYGLGSENDNLPTFVVLTTAGKGGQPLYARLWGSGFLDSKHQGVRFRAGRDPVLYLTDPAGIDRTQRRRLLDALAEIHDERSVQEGDAEIDSRIAQYEMAFRMQASVPDVMDLRDEPASTFTLYGDEAKKPGTFASNCLLARRLTERGVRCVQLYHQGWDQHGNLPGGISTQARETDQASAALVTDLKQRGLLDDTLVVWGGEFGRTSYSQGPLTVDNYGRDHHPRCYSVWLAGGGVRGGLTYGRTDEFGYNVIENPVHVHDLNATILHLLGMDHERLTYKYQGRRFRLTDVHGRVVRDLLS